MPKHEPYVEFRGRGASLHMACVWAFQFN